MPRKAPAFQFYTKEWISSSSVRLMSLAARGLFVDMLARQWEDGSLPDDPERIGILVGAHTNDVLSVWDQVRARFVVVAPGWIANEKLSEQRSEYDAFCKRRRRAGALGVEARTGKRPAKRSHHKVVAGVPSGIPSGQPNGDPLPSALEPKIKNTALDLGSSTSLEEGSNGTPEPPSPEVAARIADLFAEGREKPEIAHRNTSAVHDPLDQHAIAMRFLLPLYPPSSPGAGVQRCVMEWTGRIPYDGEGGLTVAIREMERRTYKAKPGMRGDRAWRDLTLAEKKRIVQGTLGPLMRQWDERRRSKAPAAVLTGTGGSA